MVLHRDQIVIMTKQKAKGFGLESNKLKKVQDFR